MSWNQIKKICLGGMGMDPDTFQSYRLDDLFLAIQGWQNKVNFDVDVQRKVAAVISLVVNQSLGGNGKGVMEFAMKAFPLPHDKAEEVAGMTPEKITALIDKYNEHLRQKRLRNGGTT